MPGNLRYAFGPKVSNRQSAPFQKPLRAGPPTSGPTATDDPILEVQLWATYAAKSASYGGTHCVESRVRTSGWLGY